MSGVGKRGLVVGLETRDLGHGQSVDKSGLVDETSKLLVSPRQLV